MIDSTMIAIIDFGSQYTKLIARRIREKNIYSEIFSYKTDIKILKNPKIKAIILSGGPSSVYKNKSPKINWNLKEINKPILGICYGMQLIIQQWGGKIDSKGNGEYGLANILIKSENQIFKNLNKETDVWMSHGDQVVELNTDWNEIAVSDNNIIAGIQHKYLPIYGLQFHPEVNHTIQGETILDNFLFNISNCEKKWTSENFVDKSLIKIRNKVKNENVLCAISGGVDSAVVAVLLHKAIGNQLNCVFIDHGFLRNNEVTEVLSSLKNGIGLNINVYDYSKVFLKKITNIKDPEIKRKIIGEQFIRAFEEISEKVGNYKFLAQGTLYPDIIESGGIEDGVSDTIKSHHNVGGLPDNIKFELIEPVKDLFKDEVRKVGKQLNIPNFILNRHPFPGPGLAIRILGKINKSKINMLKSADEIFIRILKETNEYEKIWQAFCVLIPSKTVGVMGDARTYENIIALRAVTSLDGMTADWYKMPFEVLNKVSSEIINNVNGVNRVVYDITTKPPGTIEWE